MCGESNFDLKWSKIIKTAFFVFRFESMLNQKRKNESKLTSVPLINWRYDVKLGLRTSKIVFFPLRLDQSVRSIKMKRIIYFFLLYVNRRQDQLCRQKFL